jgi:hypothetical protein
MKTFTTSDSIAFFRRDARMVKGNYASHAFLVRRMFKRVVGVPPRSAKGRGQGYPSFKG